MVLHGRHKRFTGYAAVLNRGLGVGLAKKEAFEQKLIGGQRVTEMLRRMMV